MPYTYGVEYTDLGTRDREEMARGQYKPPKQQPQQTASSPANTDETNPSTPETQPASATSAPRVATSNVGADPFQEAVRRRAMQDQNIGRDEAATSYAQWKDNVYTAFGNQKAAVERGNQGVYSAGLNLWQSYDAVAKGDDSQEAQFAAQQAAAQFGAIVAENHGWTFISSANGVDSGFDGKMFNFAYQDQRTGQQFVKSMSVDSLRKALENKGLVEKDQNDPTRPVNISDMWVKDFESGFDADKAEVIANDKTRPAEYRRYVRQQLRYKLKEEFLREAEAKWMAEMDRRYNVDVANSQGRNLYNQKNQTNVLQQRVRNEGMAAQAVPSETGQQQQVPSLSGELQGYSAGGGGGSSVHVADYTDIPQDNRGEFDPTRASADFEERWKSRNVGSDLDDVSLRNNIKQFSVEGDMNTDPEVIDLRRRQRNGTITSGGLARLQELTAGSDTITDADRDVMSRLGYGKEAMDEQERVARDMTRKNYDESGASRKRDIQEELGAKAVKDFDALLSRYNDEDEAIFNAMNEEGYDDAGHAERISKQDRDRERELLSVVREMTPEQRQEILRERDASGHFTERARRLRSALLYARDMGTIRRFLRGEDLRTDASELDRDAEVGDLAAVDTNAARARREARLEKSRQEEQVDAAENEADQTADSSRTSLPSQDTQGEEPPTNQVETTPSERYEPAENDSGVQLEEFTTDEVQRLEPTERGRLPGFDFNKSDDRTTRAFDRAGEVMQKRSEAEQKSIATRQNNVKTKSNSLADRFDIPPETGPEARFGLGAGNRQWKDKARGGKPSTDEIVKSLIDEFEYGIDNSRLSKLVADMFKEYNDAFDRIGYGFDQNLQMRIAAQRHNMNPADAEKLLLAIKQNKALREKFLRQYQSQNP